VTVDPAVLRTVMAAYPTGVTIVTSGHGDTQCGMAANSFTSVSLDPPIVLVCSQTGARTCEAAKSSGRFAIHLMAHDQVEHVRAFVGRDAARFDAVPFDLDPDGVPILRHWLALLVCSVHQVSEIGDHEVLYGLVERCERRDDAPLLFHDSALRMLPRLPAIRASGPGLVIDDEMDLNDPLVRVLAPPRVVQAEERRSH
jgi:3-hydroxy-9,10-secoandrosta-1,3,5(10)-triene-9,17-dione monooxygenase reductase component